MSYVNPLGAKWTETNDLLLASVNCAGIQQPVVLLGPAYRFHECQGAIDGTIMPRLAGLAAQELQNIPFSFTFRLPAAEMGISTEFRTYLFGVGTSTHSLLTQGWSANEAGFVWSDGRVAEISLPVLPYKSGDLVDIDFEVAPFITGVLKSQIVVLQIRGQLPHSFQLSRSIEHIRLPRITVGSGDLDIGFTLPNATTPRSLGISSDLRTLGIGLRRITVYGKPQE